MKTHAKLAVVVALLGIAGIFGWSILESYIAEQESSQLSDVGEKGSIKLAVDGWIGYFPLCSPEMKKRLNRDGYGLKCTDDAADYSQRFKKLKAGDYHFAVATVDSFLLNGEDYNYPGSIIAVVDESKGGDAIVARKSTASSLEALKDNKALKIGFTPDSPSHHLLKSVASHFDMKMLMDSSNQVPSNGSEDALELLQDGKVDVAVLWEPEVSKALNDDDFVRLLGTEDTQQLVVDILIAGHKTLKRDENMISSFMKAYFKTLKYYRDNQDDFIKDIKRHYDIDKKTANNLLTGVKWASLTENAEHWFGVTQAGYVEEALVDTIDSAVDILLESDDFSRNPIPNSDSYRLLNSRYIDAMYRSFANAGGFTVKGSSNNTVSRFSQLSDSQWNSLKEVGSLKIRKITFASGTSDLTSEGKHQVDQLTKDLNHYPNFRVEVRGHTGLRGDAAANKRLSEERAASVLSYIKATSSPEENRIRAKGYGSSRPLAKQAGESNRAYGYRLPRVEIALVREEL